MSDVDEPVTSVQKLETEASKEGSNSSLPDTNPTTLEANVADEVPENKNSQEKQFATIEGELLDFEDFNEKLPDGDKTVDAKSSDTEDGQCPSEKANSIEEGEDEGACSEDEDLEEGEISSDKKENSTPAVCRFYHRGMCYYGSACRFLHPNDKKGNYNMFEPSPKIYTDSYSALGPSMGVVNHRRSIPFLPAPPPPVYEVESAWERGLKEAKVLLKRANKRKDEPDFEEKRLNMGLAPCNRYPTDFNKENDSSPKREGRNKSRERRDSFKYPDAYNYNDYGDSKDFYPYENETEKNFRERPNPRRQSVERYSRNGSRPHWNNPRSEDVRTQRSDNPHTYFDPWQRSRSPVRNRTSRSVSCSPVSSYSRSSHSSRSSSQSSYASSKRTSSSRSRSRSHSRSLSMDSVSSASSQNSSASHSSGSVSSRNRKAKPVSRTAASSNFHSKSPPKVKVKTEPLDETEHMEERFQRSEAETIANLHHLMPNFSEKPREPVRGLHKQPIKLTLLNKNPPPKLPNPLKTPDVIKKPEATKTNLQRKRPLSPPVQAPTVVKKSASTRRDDLLKQLRAVEDAIARKRAKF